ncbi:hypothetical protein [Novosphingobium sp.]|uniref:hypothetical protein n=1 Tax=Novosphingobium sp. TaxID=1874826 RepID=UPI003341C3DA
MSFTALRLIDWIWTVRGSLPIAPGLSVDEAAARLDPLFHDPGTTRQRDGDVVTFHKVNPLSQDKLAVFDRGRLQIAAGLTGGTLRYELVGRALLFCFLLPVFFLGVSAIVDGSKISGRVFAGIFTVLYVAGRWLEPRLVAGLFTRALAGGAVPSRNDRPGVAGNGAG